MPATDKYWRNIKRMHVVFALSCIALLGVTLLMMSADHDREWKPIQQTNEKINTLRLQLELKDHGALTPEQIEVLASGLTNEQIEKLDIPVGAAASEYVEQARTLERQIADAEEALAGRHATIEPIEKEIKGLALEFDLLSRADRGQKAVRDKARADFDLAVRDDLPEPVREELFQTFKAEQAKVDENVVAVEQAKTALDAKQQELAAATEERDELLAELKKLRADEDRLRAARNKLDPENTFAWMKRKSMELPILDGFNGHLRIRQDWLPDLDITLGMATTARFDRCRTCHLNADATLAGGVPAFPAGHPESEDYRDWVADNAYPQPYSTHPRTDVYLTATSPHPVTTFGCTVCHQGNGSGTSFQDAEHGPNNPSQEHEWEHEFGYHPNHFWEYPMHPERFLESSCIKCHHNVIELAVSPEYGPTAPKVARGFELIGKYGCFGCHEIHGFDGDDRIGPDLRLEPNYAAAAQQVLTDPAFDAEPQALAEAGLGTVASLVRQVVAEPLDAEESRHALRALLLADKTADEKQFTERTRGLASALEDVAHPGKYRKAGPALRHVGSKVSRGWLEFWTEKPKRFRPSTKMPQFWDLSNQQDHMAIEMTPVEVAGVAQYLLDKSQESDLLAPAEGYEPDAARGAEAFSRKGCLACHQIGMYPKADSDFGPDLSRVHAKIKPGFRTADGGFDTQSEGFRWLYTWVIDPQRHHPRSRMPNLYVNEDATADSNPAADIAAFLLTNRSSLVLTGMPEDEDDAQEILEIVGDALGIDPDANPDKIRPYLTDLPKVLKVYVDLDEMADLQEELEDVGATVEVQRDDIAKEYNPANYMPESEVDLHLDELVELYLRKALTKAQTEKVLATRTFPREADDIKGDEIELAGPAPESDAEWRVRKLNYVGRKTISRYGCYGCHDVPGFETARPIGTVLQDWGRKDTSKLATEHIYEYLKHHGEPDGSSTEEKVANAIARANGDEFDSAEEAEEALRPAYFYESLAHHGRAGFLWQKLRAPRSYDFEKIETKGFDERLKMPKFPVDDEEIEAIATFVLGLVAEPPPTEYVYTPDARATDRIEGEWLLEKYNCVGCHYTEMPAITVAVDPDGDANFQAFDSVEAIADADSADFFEHSLRAMLDIKPIRDAYVGESADGKAIVRFHGMLDSIMSDPEEPASDIDFNAHRFTTWENVNVGRPGQTKLVTVDSPMVAVAPTDVIEMGEGRGGSFALHLVELLAGDPYSIDPRMADVKKLAWQSVPPPLINEGAKVQTQWLYRFLRDPGRLRKMTVLRMPKFNMSQAEARTLANYFAAKDGVPYPYQNLTPKDPGYLAEKSVLLSAAEDEPIDYLQQSWQLLHNTKVQCYKCHQVGAMKFSGPRGPKDVRGPDLGGVNARLRPEWLEVWLSKPAWMLPYTSMPVNYPKPKPGEAPKVDTFGGRVDMQILGVRDALLNYHEAIEEYGKIKVAPPTTDAAAGGGAAPAGPGSEANGTAPSPPGEAKPEPAPEPTDESASTPSEPSPETPGE